MFDWSWFTSYYVDLPNDRYATTIPMTCPRCLLDWSVNGIAMPIRGNVYRGWGAPNKGGTSTTYYECLRCGHTAYEQSYRH